jgi:hypothetical protein
MLFGAYRAWQALSPRGAVVYGAVGLFGILGAIFFPEWLAVVGYASTAVLAVLYVHNSGALSSAARTITNGADAALRKIAAGEVAPAKAFSEWVASMRRVADPGDAAVVNKVAAAEGVHEDVRI